MCAKERERECVCKRERECVCVTWRGWEQGRRRVSFACTCVCLRRDVEVVVAVVVVNVVANIVCIVKNCKWWLINFAQSLKPETRLNKFKSFFFNFHRTVARNEKLQETIVSNVFTGFKKLRFGTERKKN